MNTTHIIMIFRIIIIIIIILLLDSNITHAITNHIVRPFFIIYCVYALTSIYVRFFLIVLLLRCFWASLSSKFLSLDNVLIPLFLPVMC